MSQFSEQGYLIVKNILPNHEYYFKKCMQVKDRKKLWYRLDGDGQTPAGTPNFYKLPIMEKLLKSMLTKMEELTSLKLFKTYSYMRIYQFRNVLEQHTDRRACEISVTINMGGDPKGTDIWPIFIADADDNIKKVYLKAGDGMLYKGAELLHWRERFHGEQLVQGFLHYVDKNGPNFWAKDDLIK